MPHDSARFRERMRFWRGISWQFDSTGPRSVGARIIAKWLLRRNRSHVLGNRMGELVQHLLRADLHEIPKLEVPVLQDTLGLLALGFPRMGRDETLELRLSVRRSREPSQASR